MENNEQIIKDYKSGKISFRELCEKASVSPRIREFVRLIRKKFDLEEPSKKQEKQNGM